jgi:hypothetical protein
MKNNKEVQEDKSKTNVSIKKIFEFYCSYTKWKLCERHKMTEKEAEKYAKQHNLRYVEED